jgi:hypothetical protein
VLKLFGLAPGQLTPLTIRGAVISDDGTQTTVVVNHEQGHIFQNIIQHVRLL